jgi:hypothetical protein
VVLVALQPYRQCFLQSELAGGQRASCLKFLMTDKTVLVRLFVGGQTGWRFFVSDRGNLRIVWVKLHFHAEHRIRLRQSRAAN